MTTTAALLENKHNRILLMKFLAVFLFVTLWCSCAFAKGSNFIDSAFYNFQHKNYPRAIQLYKQLIAKTHYTYQMEMLAMCYAQMDSVDQEKRILEDVIGVPEKNQFDYDKSVTCCRTLADLYLKEKNYKKALVLYNLYGLKWKKARFDDVNMLEFNLDKENARSKCFEGLNMTDSAANILTPYIFCTYKSLRWAMRGFSLKDPANLKDSLKQDSVCARYLSLLRRLHSNREIKAALAIAEESFYYTENRKYTRDDYLWIDLTCGFKFYDTDDIYMTRGMGNKAEHILPEIQTPFYTREYQLQRFRELPLCRMIAALPDTN